jgi:prepilin-type N-terminal cleavage/methylation domain-containing protein
MKTPSRHGQAAFTLIELMAVITIIVLLAALVVGAMGFVNERQAKEKAKVQMALLSKALEEYKLDMGGYPGTKSASGGYYGGANADGTNGDFSKVLYTALFYEGYELSTNPNRADPDKVKAPKIYGPELDPTNSKQGWTTGAGSTPPANLNITDPWGNNYRYRVGASAQNPDFDLWSMGKDGKSNPDNASDTVNRDDIKAP